MIPTEFHFIVSLYNYFRMDYSRAPESHYIYFFSSKKSQSYEMNNRETNVDMHLNSTRTKILNRMPCFTRKYLRGKKDKR